MKKTLTLRRAFAWLAGIVGISALLMVIASTGSSDVTRARLERSLPATFANLYVQQAAILGHGGLTVASLDPKASCDKGGPHVPDQGAGADWICYMTWNDPNIDRTLLPGKFELNAHTNDCYTATGPSKIVGLLAIADSKGRDVRNPVHEFDACFDPNGPNKPTGVNLQPPTSSTASAVATLEMLGGAVLVDRRGTLAVKVSCSDGVGGCGGSITARLDGTPLGSATYAFAPTKAGTVDFRLDRAQQIAGGRLVLTATPVIGSTVASTRTLRVPPA